MLVVHLVALAGIVADQLTMVPVVGWTAAATVVGLTVADVVVATVVVVDSPP